MLPISSFSYFMCSIRTSFRKNTFLCFFFFQVVGWLTYLKEKGDKNLKMAFMVRNFKCLRSVRLWSWHWKLTLEDQILALFDISALLTTNIYSYSNLRTFTVLPKGSMYVQCKAVCTLYILLYCYKVCNSKTNSNAISVMVHSLARSRCWYVRRTVGNGGLIPPPPRFWQIS